MEIEIKPYRCLPCALEVFKINGKDANTDDFGEMETTGGSCMDSACGCDFVPKMPKQEILDKYNINLDEYSDICEELRDTLFIRGCGWCS